MCQYSAINGNLSNWHYKHLSFLSKLGAGLMIIESTAVNKQGRITKKDLLISNNTQAKSFSTLLKKLKKNRIKVGIQLSHSGRKGSSVLPWVKSNMPLKKGWVTCAPSSLRRDKHWPVPKSLTLKEMDKIKFDFVHSSKLANKAGFDCLEIHMAHGYLLHQFFSPISNIRNDLYGGNLENRCRYLIEIAREVRKVWPNTKILGARITASDNLKRGIKIKESIVLAKKLEEIGFDYLAVTSGGILPKTNMKFIPGYQLDMAKKIKKSVNIRVVALGMINSKKLILEVFKKKIADMVAVSRRFIYEPEWLLKKNSKIQKIKQSLIPKPYLKCFENI